MNRPEHISIALPKGRLAEESLELFAASGVMNPDVVDMKTRKLVFTDEENAVTVYLIRNMDVPTYVEHGAADLGVVGKDILLETRADAYEFLDLGFGYCRLCVAGLVDRQADYRHDVRIATKYPNIAKDFFGSKGVFAEVIKLYGSVELGPIVELSDYIVDLVSTGKTLKENGLAEVETILESTARLIGNRNLSICKHERIKHFIDAFAAKLD